MNSSAGIHVAASAGSVLAVIAIFAILAAPAGHAMGAVHSTPASAKVEYGDLNLSSVEGVRSAIDGPTVTRSVVMTRVRPIPNRFPLGDLCLHPFAKVTVFLPRTGHHGDEAATGSVDVVQIFEAAQLGIRDIKEV